MSRATGIVALAICCRYKMSNHSKTFKNFSLLKEKLKEFSNKGHLNNSTKIIKPQKQQIENEKINKKPIKTNKEKKRLYQLTTNKKTTTQKNRVKKYRKNNKIQINENTKVACQLLKKTENPLVDNLRKQAREQIYDGSSGITEIVIGLDFGTATSKVILMESGRKISWAIPFTQSTNNPYLIPSAISLNNGEYSLNDSDNTFSNLKMPLLRKVGCSDDELANVVAYLSLLIHHAREWFLENAANTFPGFEFDWLINLGIPAADYNNESLVDRFSTALLCSANLSLQVDGKVNKNLVLSEIEKAKSQSSETYAISGDFHPEAINVFPEIAAQLHGYVSSDKWDVDRPKFMLVDIGGSTVDASIVNVIKKSKAELKYNFLKSAVTLQGTVILHQKRLRWIKSNIDPHHFVYPKLSKELDNITINKNPHIALPKMVCDYLEDAHFPGGEYKENIDNQFYEEYGPQLYNNVILPVKGKIDSELSQWGSLQFLLCGGGSLHPLYNRFINAINMNKNIHVNLDAIKLEKPEKLIAPDLKDDDYHRLSVAYGLAHEQLGKVIRESNINEITPMGNMQNTFSEKYISKDQI